MGIFDAFSKKKEESVELPAPPAPSAEAEIEAPELDIEPVSAPEPEESEQEQIIEEEVEAEPEERQPIPREGPIFVSMQDYQIILSGVNSIKSKLGEVDDTYKNLSHIKTSQDKELENWRKSLEDLQRKLTFVDEVVFGK